MCIWSKTINSTGLPDFVGMVGIRPSFDVPNSTTSEAEIVFATREIKCQLDIIELH